MKFGSHAVELTWRSCNAVFGWTKMCSSNSPSSRVTVPSPSSRMWNSALLSWTSWGNGLRAQKTSTLWVHRVCSFRVFPLNQQKKIKKATYVSLCNVHVVWSFWHGQIGDREMQRDFVLEILHFVHWSFTTILHQNLVLRLSEKTCETLWNSFVFCLKSSYTIYKNNMCIFYMPFLECFTNRCSFHQFKKNKYIIRMYGGLSYQSQHKPCGLCVPSLPDLHPFYNLHSAAYCTYVLYATYVHYIYFWIVLSFVVSFLHSVYNLFNPFFLFLS